MTCELIERVARAIKSSVAYSSFWPNSDYEIMARAAIRVIAPAVLEDVSALEESRAWAVGLKAHEIRALKTRYEQ